MNDYFYLIIYNSITLSEYIFELLSMNWEKRVILVIITFVVYMYVKKAFEDQPEVALYRRILKTAYHGLHIQLEATQQQYL